MRNPGGTVCRERDASMRAQRVLDLGASMAASPWRLTVAWWWSLSALVRAGLVMHAFFSRARERRLL